MTCQARSLIQLSGIAKENEATIKERRENQLLRPIFINGVEVGYAYSQNDSDRKLAVRGITIVLFHFISAGHQALALLPHCFKTYRDKSTNYEELMVLHRMNLIEFTPGYGTDKYVEVNRLCAWAGFESGGCIVARSQMHSIVSENPCLEDIVEKRLLMPSFMGEDIIFPMDGPLGRIGLPLNETLLCNSSDPDYNKCLISQLRLSDQRLWIQRLSNFIPEKLSWASLSSRLNAWQPTKLICLPVSVIDEINSCSYIPLAGPIRPPETNPHCGRGFSNARRRRANMNDYYNCPERLRNPEKTNDIDEDPSNFLPSYAQKEVKEKNSSNIQSTEEGNGSIYRIASAYEMSRRDRYFSSQDARINRGEGGVQTSTSPLRRLGLISCEGNPPAMTTTDEAIPVRSQLPTESSSIFTQLALIVGYAKAKRTTEAHPREKNINRLANLALDESPSPSIPSTSPSSTPSPPSHPLSPNLSPATLSPSTSVLSPTLCPTSPSPSTLPRALTSSSTPRRTSQSMSSSDDSRKNSRGGKRNTQTDSASPNYSARTSTPIQDSRSTLSSESQGIEEDLIDWNGDLIPSKDIPHVETSTHLLDL